MAELAQIALQSLKVTARYPFVPTVGKNPTTSAKGGRGLAVVSKKEN